VERKSMELSLESGTGPTSLSHLIGQRQVIRQVEVALDAAQIDARRFDHALLVGPPGLGKSAVANVIACEMAGGFHEALGQSLKSPSDLNALLLGARDRDVVFIDECHELRKEFQTALYLALDKRALFVRGSGGKPQGIPIADFTLLIATTDEYCLLQPLRDRMKLLLRYEFYSVEELVGVLKHRIKAWQWIAEESVLPTIAERSRGTPRLALRLLQSCHRVCRALGETDITLAHLSRACELEQIDRLGLGPTEQAYLRILVDGPTRLNVIASMLGLPQRTVSQVTEAFLIRAGLVTKDHQGRRELTAKGREYLSRSSQLPVVLPSK
jgi:holliday junction DNA helicase RuvB